MTFSHSHTTSLFFWFVPLSRNSISFKYYQKKKIWLWHWARMQSIWIQRLALLQISNMTLGTPINLLHLSSLAVKWKESYYFFLARLLVFSAEPISVFRAEFPGITTSINLAEAMKVKCCAKSQAEGGQRQDLEALPGPCTTCTCILAVSGTLPGCSLPSTALLAWAGDEPLLPTDLPTTGNAAAMHLWGGSLDLKTPLEIQNLLLEHRRKIDLSLSHMETFM